MNILRSLLFLNNRPEALSAITYSMRERERERERKHINWKSKTHAHAHHYHNICTCHTYMYIDKVKFSMKVNLAMG